MKHDVKPFSPNDARKARGSTGPKEVLEAVNQLLAERYVEGTITLKQKDIKARIMDLMYGHLDASADRPFDYDWMNFEPVYKDAGWQVVYDKPGYNESYDAFFQFTPGRGRRIA